MWPIGSAPVVDGAPAVLRTQTTSGTGEYPLTGPLMTRFEYGAPRLSIQRMQSPTGVPCSSTGTVLDHWPVQLTASIRLASTTPEAMARRAASVTSSHHSAASCTAPPPGRQPGLDRAVVVPRDASGERDQPDLRPAGAEVDREDEALVAICGGGG